MYIALISLIIFVCFLLALVVLAQNPKGGGLSSQFGAGGTAQLMGVKRTGDLLERLTWGFAIALMVLSLGTQMVNSASGDSAPVRSVNQQRAMETQVPATMPAPAPTAPAPSAPAQQAPATAPATTPAP
ncbi:preprotein translocase subunit SecG [Hymenobacter sp. DG25B]|jgi:preprotein translocase subunit SecG|uniref:preprotein translocase subunit SecG n=1 Tax=Hymenobacter sp. DG25B TaxID=1385664 RepID=UPI000540DAF1|nr:preprotein translocase subunit SecG [Hymenobacter sp. DG25B]AIZ64065.1 preprotein translocase subunit SecG [Hymenobacter sp. DG25B]